MAATTAKVLVFAVHNWKYAPIFQALKRLLSEGVIGTPRQSNSPPYAPTCRDDRVAFRSADGWRWDFAGPRLARLLFLLFLLDAAPQSLTATVERRLFLSAGVEDTVTCDVTFPQTQARLYLTWAASQRRTWLWYMASVERFVSMTHGS